MGVTCIFLKDIPPLQIKPTLPDLAIWQLQDNFYSG